MNRFKDRKDAGRLLAQALLKYKNDTHAIVIGLPRGGVVPAAEVAKLLHLPLDVIVPRKIGAPLQPELAIGAAAEDGTVLYNQDVMQMLGLVPEDVQYIVNAEVKEAQRRVRLFRNNRPPLDLHGKTAIIVDDGVATGATMHAALLSARKKGAQRIVLALPVAPPDFRAMIANDVDEIVILKEAAFFPGISFFYEEFEQVPDDVVVSLLA